MHLNITHWQEHLNYPDWYSRLETDISKYFLPVVHDNPELKHARHVIYNIIEKKLIDGSLPLATAGPNLDAQRQPVDTLIIHHTEEDSTMPPSRLSAIGLLRLYAPKYLDNNVIDHQLKGNTIWSGHFWEGKQVFYGYHWLVFPDGSTQRLLDDSNIGWHSGNWKINTRSVGIALAGNYEHSTPPKTQLLATAQLISDVYPAVEKHSIHGHREVKEHRTCPGDQFLSGWKQVLLSSVFTYFLFLAL